MNKIEMIEIIVSDAICLIAAGSFKPQETTDQEFLANLRSELINLSIEYLIELACKVKIMAMSDDERKKLYFEMSEVRFNNNPEIDRRGKTDQEFLCCIKKEIDNLDNYSLSTNLLFAMTTVEMELNNE